MVEQHMESVEIETAMIQLDQFLKWAGIVDTGGQTKDLLLQRLIYVNGTLATEKRKQLHPGDQIEIKGTGAWQIIREKE